MCRCFWDLLGIRRIGGHREGNSEEGIGVCEDGICRDRRKMKT